MGPLGPLGPQWPCRPQGEQGPPESTQLVDAGQVEVDIVHVKLERAQRV